MPTTLLGASQHFMQWTVANSNKHQSWTQWHFLTDLVCWCGSLINNNPHALIHTLVHYVINSGLSCQQHNGHHKQLFTIFNSHWLTFVRKALIVHCVRLLDSWSHCCTQKPNLQACDHGYVLTFFLSAVWNYNGIHNECSKMFFLVQSCGNTVQNTLQCSALHGQICLLCLPANI